MRKFVSITTAAALVAAFGISSANAAQFNTRPIAFPNSGSLQTALDNITVSGPGIDVVNDQDPFARFTNTASGGALATFVIEVASFAGTNEFGIYDTTTGAKAEIFGGSQGQGDQAIVSFLADGSISVNFSQVSGPGTFQTGPSNFGFYVDVFEAGVGQGGDGDSSTLDYTVYSEDDLNVGGAAQALVYQGDDSTKLQLPGLSAGTFTNDEFIIAFEDLLVGAGYSDEDYSDLVVVVESIAPIPAPGAFLLGCLGLGVISSVRRRLS